MSRTTHGKSGTATHKSWLRMLRRCRYKSVPGYHRYGGRGITVCARWQGADGFAPAGRRDPPAEAIAGRGNRLTPSRRRGRAGDRRHRPR